MKTVALDLDNLTIEEITKIRKMARLKKLNIFYDKNLIITRLCDKLLDFELEKEK